jgi:hypothetical protein
MKGGTNNSLLLSSRAQQSLAACCPAPAPLNGRHRPKPTTTTGTYPGSRVITTYGLCLVVVASSQLTVRNTSSASCCPCGSYLPCRRLEMEPSTGRGSLCASVSDAHQCRSPLRTSNGLRCGWELLGCRTSTKYFTSMRAPPPGRPPARP